MLFTREQYLELMTYGQFERPMFVELFGPLIGLEDEWQAQGATPAELDLTAFDWDHVDRVWAGGNTGPRGGAPRVVLEDTPTHRLERDQFGRTLKLDKRTATIPLPLDFPVKNMDDWRRFKPMFEYHEDRLDRRQAEAAKLARTQGKLVVAGIPGVFNMARELMGEEVACTACYDQPELWHDLSETLRRTATRVLKHLVALTPLDQLSVHEDFAGKSGPLIGPKHIREFMQPHYRAAWEIAQGAGARIFQLDTDGNINSVVDALLDCGLTSILPMEPAAGMDIVALRAKYGKRLALVGGIDKHALRRGRAAIRAELEYKLQPAVWKMGGVVYSLDHRIPNGTPLADYRYYVDLGREILGLPPRRPDVRGWHRMAF